MQFQVPQFEIENKLIGPFTITEVLYISVVSIISFLLFPILTIWLWFLVSATLIGGALAVALVKIQGRPMIVFLSSAFQYLWGPKILFLKPPIIKIDGLKHIAPLPPSKKFEASKQVITPASVLPQAERLTPEQKPLTSVTPEQLPQQIETQQQSPARLATPKESSSQETTTTIIPDASAIPIAPIPPPIMSVNPELMMPSSSVPYTKKKLSRLQSLFNKITTTSSPIPFRETSIKQSNTKQTEQYELAQTITGETTVVRRVDYR